MSSQEEGQAVEHAGIKATVWSCDAPELVVVLCHGYAAPGDDLHRLREELISLEPTLGEGVTWILPEGPEIAEANPWFGRAWWQIEMDVVKRAVVEHEHRGLHDALEVGLDSAAAKMNAFLDEALSIINADACRLVLGGFSQGSMLMADLALSSTRPVSALALLSTTLLKADRWREGARRRAGLPVLIAHGERDRLLPIDGARDLAALLDDEGLRVERAFFAGSHKMPASVHHALAALLRSQLEAS